MFLSYYQHSMTPLQIKVGRFLVKAQGKLRLGGSILDSSPVFALLPWCLSFFKHSALRSVPRRLDLKWMRFPVRWLACSTISCDNLGRSMIPSKESIFVSDGASLRLRVDESSGVRLRRGVFFFPLSLLLHIEYLFVVVAHVFNLFYVSWCGCLIYTAVKKAGMVVLRFFPAGFSHHATFIFRLPSTKYPGSFFYPDIQRVFGHSHKLFLAYQKKKEKKNENTFRKNATVCSSSLTCYSLLQCLLPPVIVALTGSPLLSSPPLCGIQRLLNK